MASSLPAGVTIRATVTPQFAEILTQPALAFVAKLHRQFESRRLGGRAPPPRLIRLSRAVWPV